jgi:Ser-tRNA(Ala) deacylase AlaX
MDNFKQRSDTGLEEEKKNYNTPSNKLSFTSISNRYIHMQGHAVAHLVEALSYKPEGRGFESR